MFMHVYEVNRVYLWHYIVWNEIRDRNINCIINEIKALKILINILIKNCVLLMKTLWFSRVPNQIINEVKLHVQILY